MDKLKEWVMTYVVEKFLGGVLGKALSASNGKRTYIGLGVLVLLELAKYVLPVFVAVPPGILEAIDSLILVVTGATGTFASVKAEKLWDGLKKAVDETLAASSPESK